ncbi:2,3-butanediol dehydrogenase [Halotalea alkalilenta]|uniref:2,3-butanediol dehydrogenase n=1 Tax=Halotalea alkalilenta TaxID=376489 RepID=UPI000480F428|nr:2,3-butanediol dehydrogenase [Halotalea alkalilenta]
MKALRWYAAKDIRIEDLDEPKAEEGRVKIKVKWCGICGTDLHEYLAGPIFIPVDEPHPITGEKAPITLGHEFCGEIVEVGEGVTGHAVGDRVTVEPVLFDPNSKASRRGLYNLCDKLGFYGLAGMGGGFSEYASVPASIVHRLPDSVSYEQGALTEPASVAVHAVRESRFEVGDKAAVFGAGPIGLLVVEALKAAGAHEIYVVELSAQRRARAAALGARVIDPTEVDAVAEIVAATDGGVDVAYEVTGVPAVLQQSIDCVRIQGETMIVSVWEKPAPIQPNQILFKERHLTGVLGYRNVFPATLALMEQGYFKPEDFVTRKIALENVIEQGFTALIEEKDQVKILVSPEMS